MVKVWGPLMAIWFAIFLWGGISDGVLGTGFDQSTLNELNQGVITTAPTNTFIVVKWIGTALSTLVAMANALLLNYSMFDGGWVIIRWFGLACLASPIWAELGARLLGGRV